MISGIEIDESLCKICYERAGQITVIVKTNCPHCNGKKMIRICERCYSNNKGKGFWKEGTDTSKIK